MVKLNKNEKWKIYEKNKKFLMLCCFMAMMIGSTLVANAQERAYVVCPNCQKGSMVTTEVSYTTWNYTSVARKCTYCTYGEDRQQERKKMSTEKCSSCAYKSMRTTTETRWVCHGYY